MALQADGIADLIKMTQRDLGKMKWTEVATDIQDHIAFNTLWRRERINFQSGYGIQWNIQTTHSGAASHRGLYGVDNVNVGDVMQTANIPWRHANTNYAIERRELAMNRLPARIVELVKIRRADAMISKAELIEQAFWTKPTNSSDQLEPYGVDYWLVYNAATGFNGGTPSGFTDVAGLNTTTYTRHRNYTAQYTSITKADAIKKLRRAMRFTRFRTPLGANVSSYNRGDRYGLYTNDSVISSVEDIAEGQNDNLGADVAAMDDRTMIRRVRFTWVPQLEGKTGDPIYGLNWGVFRPVVLSGEWMVEDGPDKGANQHTVWQTHVDTTYNYECRNRRLNFLLATANPNTTS